jgi:hypothetical protein
MVVINKWTLAMPCGRQDVFYRRRITLHDFSHISSDELVSDKGIDSNSLLIEDNDSSVKTVYRQLIRGMASS